MVSPWETRGDKNQGGLYVSLLSVNTYTHNIFGNLSLRLHFFNLKRKREECFTLLSFGGTPPNSG